MTEMKLDFSTFLMSMASSAYCSLGLAPNPMTQKVEKNIASAKQQIDLLEIMKEKTKGNLTKDENDLMENILYHLHITYVNEVKRDEEKKA